MVKLIRYWIEFKRTEENRPLLSSKAMLIGCGVSAFTDEDALNIIKQEVFPDDDIPEIEKMVANVDVNTLNKGHVIPHMGAVSVRGIWYPRGYELL